MTLAAAPVASRSDWQQAFALLDDAFDLEPAAQPAWLASLPPAQAHLAPMLAQLLRARAEVADTDFLQAPPTFAFEQAIASVPASLPASALASSAPTAPQA